MGTAGSDPFTSRVTPSRVAAPLSPGFLSAVRTAALRHQGAVSELAQWWVSTQTAHAPHTVAPTYLRRRVGPGPRRGGEVSASLGVRRPPVPPPRAGAAPRPGHGPRRPSGRHGIKS